MVLFIKNMVCNRCVMAVSQELEKLNVQTNRINLGEVELQKPLTIKQIQQLTERLNFLGFELLDDLRQRQI
ncbi:AraC family transcriptional regulator, partial [Vibrio parahaemolyticus]